MQDYSPSLNGVASQVHSLLRKYNALDYFRDRVREAAQEHIEALAECERRKKLRREAAAKEGVLSLPLDEAIRRFVERTTANSPGASLPSSRPTNRQREAEICKAEREATKAGI